ncbi:MAG: hypothetical protein EOM55_03890 [Clostridia bacterium]|nr:hypothetical protein [Clostridia bacterium]
MKGGKMTKIFKLIKGEMRKIFSGVGIFIMSALLILTLTICPKFFSPSEKVDSSTGVNISTISVKTAYESFLISKDEYNNSLSEIQNDINNFISNNADFKQKLLDDFEEIILTRQSFHSAVLSEDISGENGSFNKLNVLRTQVSELYDTYNAYINGQTSPLILVNDELNYEIDSEILAFKRLIETTGDNTYIYFQNIDETIEEFSFINNINELLIKTKNLYYSNIALTTILSDYSTLKNDEKSAILSEMSILYTSALSDEGVNLNAENISLINSDALKYLSFTNNSTNILKSKFLLSITTNLSDTEISQYVGYEDFNSYFYEETFTKNLYLIENNFVDSSLSNTFSFNINSDNSTNAFDYMFFAMEIISFLIITFTVILGAGIISKEFSDGTIKLLAMRPYSRNKIIFSKILATMFVGFLFLIICAIVAFITGLIIYGLSFPTALVVINASVAFTTPIWILFLIYIGLLMIKIWIFSLIAIAISTIFKSYVLAVCVSAGLYLVNIILTFIANGAAFLKFNIFSHFDLFKYFGGSFIKSGTESNITGLFSLSVIADTNLWISVIVISTLALVLNILIFSVFKHRDIA